MLCQSTRLPTTYQKQSRTCAEMYWGKYLIGNRVAFEDRYKHTQRTGDAGNGSPPAAYCDVHQAFPLPHDLGLPTALDTASFVHYRSVCCERVSILAYSSGRRSACPWTKSGRLCRYVEGSSTGCTWSHVFPANESDKLTRLIVKLLGWAYLVHLFST